MRRSGIVIGSLGRWGEELVFEAGEGYVWCLVLGEGGGWIFERAVGCSGGG